MSVTQHFQTNALYPGGEGKCFKTNSEVPYDKTFTSAGRPYGIGTHDPYPGGIPADFNHRTIFKVTKNIEDVWPLIWNLKEWGVDVSLALQFSQSIVYDEGPLVELVAVNFDILGRFHYAVFDDPGENFDFVNSAFIYDGSPHERVCGVGKQTEFKRVGAPITTEPKIPLILPSISVPIISSESYDDSASDSQDIVNSDLGGNAEFFRGAYRTGIITDFPMDTRFYITPFYIKLMGATCEIYFDTNIECHGNDFGIYLTNTAGYDLVGYSGTIETDVTISFLGESVSAKLWFLNDSGPNTTFNSFTLSYNITVTTAYTYP